MIGASLRIALAIDILCFSPPDSVEPPSPTTVSYPSLRLVIKSWQQAFLQASTTSSCVAFGFPNIILFSIVSLNK